MPVSLTLKCRTGPAALDARDRHPHDHFALRRELDGVAEEVEEDLAQPAGIAEQRVRNVGGDVDRELDALFARAQREHLRGVADGLAQLEGRMLEVQPVRLDLGEVEDVVDRGRAAILPRT